MAPNEIASYFTRPYTSIKSLLEVFAPLEE
jgi:hypothetical protein